MVIGNDADLVNVC